MTRLWLRGVCTRELGFVGLRATPPELPENSERAPRAFLQRAGASYSCPIDLASRPRPPVAVLLSPPTERALSAFLRRAGCSSRRPLLPDCLDSRATLPRAVVHVNHAVTLCSTNI